MGPAYLTSSDLRVCVDIVNVNRKYLCCVGPEYCISVRTSVHNLPITCVIWDITPLVSPPSSEFDVHVQRHRDTSRRAVTWPLGTLKLHVLVARSMQQL
jgi:hypothetical protein